METLIVIAVIMILASIVMTTAKKIEQQGREKLMTNTFEIINAAMEQYADFEYQLNQNEINYSTDDERKFYTTLSLPPDCNGYFAEGVQIELEKVLVLAPGDEVSIAPVGTTMEYDPNDSGSAVLYYFLTRLPESRKTIARISKSLIADTDNKGNELKIIVATKGYPFYHFIDPWGKAIHYDYYDENADFNATFPAPDRIETKRNFPVLTSAGFDGIFDTDDDITSR